jgi:hypothetical protein
MLKMMGKGTNPDGSPVTIVCFGLSYRNLDLLRQGMPIRIKGSACGLSDEFEFVIFADEDERTMQRKVAQHIGPNTKVLIDPRFKD